MCNIWTGEHIFIWTTSTSSPQLPPQTLVCQCGAFRFNGKPENITYADYQNTYRELKIERGDEL